MYFFPILHVSHGFTELQAGGVVMISCTVIIVQEKRDLEGIKWAIECFALEVAYASLPLRSHWAHLALLNHTRARTYNTTAVFLEGRNWKFDGQHLRLSQGNRHS